MSTSSISGTSSSPSSYGASSFGQFRKDFKSLAAAIQSGNTSDAQSALAQLEKDNPNLASNSSSAFAPLLGDVQSGNISAAQQDLSQLQQMHHGHHHHAHDVSGSTDSTSTTTPSSTNSEPGSLLNVSV